MKQPRRDIAAIALVWLTACGPHQTIPACTLAVGTRPEIGPEGLPGGFLEIQSRESLNASQTHSTYCAASITFEGGTPRIWTAQHCYRVGLMEKITLHANIGDKYVPISLTTPDLISAKNIRAAFTSKDPDLVADFIDLLNGASRISKETSTITKRCLEKSVTHRSTCFTALDLVAIPTSFAPDASSDAVTAIASLKIRFSRLAASDLSLLRTYGAAQEELSTERKAWAAHAFLERYKTCVMERKAHPYCSDSYMTESLAVYENFLDVSAFSANKNRLAVSKSKVASPFEMKAKWQAVALKSGHSAREKIAGVWEKIDGRNDLYISANLTESPDATTALYAASPVGAKRSAPDTAAPHETIAVLEGDDQAERTYILRRPRTGSGAIEFSKGDSGSLLSVGIVPVAVLSHVDGNETSGGASVIPLPRRIPSGVSNETPRDAARGRGEEQKIEAGKGAADGGSAIEKASEMPSNESETQESKEPSC